MRLSRRHYGRHAVGVQCGREFGLTLKLLAIAKAENGGIQARVHPTFVPNTHPLAGVNDAFNAVFVDGHACGEMMFYGRGAAICRRPARWCLT